MLELRAFPLGSGYRTKLPKLILASRRAAVYASKRAAGTLEELGLCGA
jgi:hypothetical protein